MHAPRHDVEEFRCVEKDGRVVLRDDDGELLIELFTVLEVVRRACLREQRINARIRIERKVQSRVIALRGVPEGEKVCGAADDFAEEYRVVLPRADDVHIQV